MLPPEEEIKQTLSKPTREELLDILDRNKLDPVQELIDMYHDRDEDGELTMKRGERIALMKELMKYVHPQKKTTDGGNRGQGNLVVVLNMPDGSQDQRVLDVRSK